MTSMRRPSVLDWSLAFSLALLLAVTLATSGAAAQSSAVVADPPRDAAHPAANRQMRIANAGMGMNAVLLQASGAGPKPTLLLLHGLPGNEQNLDLAQATRRAGWNGRTERMSARNWLRPPW